MQTHSLDPGISLVQIGAMLAARKVLIGVVATSTIAAAVAISFLGFASSLQVEL